jgi:hypothetical protein
MESKGKEQEAPVASEWSVCLMSLSVLLAVSVVWSRHRVLKNTVHCAMVVISSMKAMLLNCSVPTMP